jgi:hypothetical protein
MLLSCDARQATPQLQPDQVKITDQPECRMAQLKSPRHHVYFRERLRTAGQLIQGMLSRSVNDD